MLRMRSRSWHARRVFEITIARLNASKAVTAGRVPKQEDRFARAVLLATRLGSALLTDNSESWNTTSSDRQCPRPLRASRSGHHVGSHHNAGRHSQARTRSCCSRSHNRRAGRPGDYGVCGGRAQLRCSGCRRSLRRAARTAGPRSPAPHKAPRHSQWRPQRRTILSWSWSCSVPYLTKVADQAAGCGNELTVS